MTLIFLFSRYVSVIGLNEHSQPQPKKGSSKTGKSRQNESAAANSAAPKMAPISNCVEEEEEEGGLPTYNEALEQQDSIATVCPEGGSSNSVMRVSMV